MKKFLVITGLMISTPALAGQNSFAVNEVNKITHNSAITSTVLIDNTVCHVKQSVNDGINKDVTCDNTSFSVLPGDRMFVEVYSKDQSLQYGMDIQNVDLNNGKAFLNPREIFINGRGIPASGRCVNDLNTGAFDCDIDMELKNSIHQTIHTSGGKKHIFNK